MTEKFTDITAPEYRCPTGDCPSVYKSEDGKTLAIIGERVVSELADKAGPGEACVEISTELVLASLGVDRLIVAVGSFLMADEEFSSAMISSNGDLSGMIPESAGRELAYRELVSVLDEVLSFRKELEND